MTDQIITYGATVKRSLDGISYALIPEAKGIVIPVPEVGYTEVTSLDSPNGAREYLPTLVDYGVVTLACGYTPAGFATMMSDMETARDTLTPIYYEIQLRKAASQSVSGDKINLRAYPRPMPADAGLDASIDMPVELRITGKPTYTQGS